MVLVTAQFGEPFKVIRCTRIIINGCNNCMKGDVQQRVEFYQRIVAVTEEEPTFLHRILRTDEAIFTRDGHFNQHNSHYWDHENLHVVKNSKCQMRFTVNVWVGLIGGELIGPFFIPGRLTGEVYLKFLKNDLPDLLIHLPSTILRQIVLQQDGAPPHFARPVKEYLDEQWPGWIGRRGDFV